MIEDLGITNQVRIVDRYVANEEVEIYFCASDLVVQPYISATGSGVVQVAFGFNKPVIATDVGSLSEIVIHGQNGYLVPPENSRAISDAIIDYFKNKNSKSFVDNIKNNQYRFSWDHFIDGI